MKSKKHKRKKMKKTLEDGKTYHAYESAELIVLK
jgi:hypothetical protein